jgi:hypothetical protein
MMMMTLGGTVVACLNGCCHCVVAVAPGINIKNHDKQSRARSSEILKFEVRSFEFVHVGTQINASPALLEGEGNYLTHRSVLTCTPSSI